MQGDQLADEQRVERGARLPARAEEPVLGADEADSHAVGRETELVPEEPRVLLGVGHDEVGSPEGATVDELQHACGGAATPETAPVAHEGVVEGYERVEDDGLAVGDALRGGKVEMPGVAHDQRVDAAARTLAQDPLGLGEPCELSQADRPVVALLPHRPVPLEHLDAHSPQAGDHLRVARVGAIVGPEIEDAHRRAGPLRHRSRGGSVSAAPRRRDAHCARRRTPVPRADS